jgi:23S rRNA-/tRNA-specific pseudouridylate synthase
VVNKPAGMVVHPAAGHPGGTLVHAALAHAPKWKASAERSARCGPSSGQEHLRADLVGKE